VIKTVSLTCQLNQKLRLQWQIIDPLKNLLKRTTNELKDELKKLDELLPKERDNGFRLNTSRTTPKRSELEDEIEQIRRKI